MNTHRMLPRTAAAAAIAFAAAAAAAPTHAATLGSLSLTGQNTSDGPGCEHAKLGYHVAATGTTDDGDGYDWLGLLVLDGDGTVLDHDVDPVLPGERLEYDDDTALDELNTIDNRKLTLRLVDLPSPVAPGTSESIAVVGMALNSPTRATLTVDLADAFPVCESLPLGDGSEPLLCDRSAASPFADTSPASPHTPNVACAADLSLVQGGPAGLPASQFGPSMTTSRAQLATLTANLITAVGRDLPAAPADYFDDDAGIPHETAINQLAAIGLIGANGESGASFFPERPATRAEMASFMRRALDDASHHLFGAAEDAFTDDEGHWAEGEINDLAAAGVISGKAPGTYDPDATVTREQIATFFVRLLGPVIDAPQQ